jgi:hypothetical protein
VKRRAICTRPYVEEYKSTMTNNLMVEFCGAFGRAVQVYMIKPCVESAYGFSA